MVYIGLWLFLDRKLTRVLSLIMHGTSTNYPVLVANARVHVLHRVMNQLQAVSNPFKHLSPILGSANCLMLDIIPFHPFQLWKITPPCIASFSLSSIPISDGHLLNKRCHLAKKHETCSPSIDKHWLVSWQLGSIRHSTAKLQIHVLFESHCAHPDGYVIKTNAWNRLVPDARNLKWSKMYTVYTCLTQHVH